ncbi:MAG: DEAD/DEAH box helicase [Desulfobacterales bacterium]|nr:MAG: DEAD/DEAH box helicase [Desulfobacterales bacterium]
MQGKNQVQEYIQSLKSSQRLGNQVVHHTLLSDRSPRWSKPDQPLPKEINHILRSIGIHNLYTHQVDAIDLIRSGRHTVVATPTASGKTLIYNLPVLENILHNSGSKALYIFPLKALAQDQLRTFEMLATHATTIQPSVAIYDGDTSAWHRKKIRQSPPNILLTNPEMIHLSMLPHHQKWSAFFSQLDVVVVDEVHTYRGIMGSHMAQVFRRFQRVCTYYGTAPTFIFCSATISNPDQLAKQLTGLQVDAIKESGAPAGKKHVVFINPVQGMAQTSILLLKAALYRGLRTIVYTQSRKLTELIAIWAKEQSGSFANRISAYRAGFLPEERREVEAKLANGDLLAVISTSALELGIDIGDLDLCLLVGYPGTVVATWQRSGRVGRSAQDAALVLIAGEDALDQYFMRHPEDFIQREPEAAVVNPFNPDILAKHLVCAAAELTLRSDEAFISDSVAKQSLMDLEHKGVLLRSADGEEVYSSRRAPHRSVDLRGTGSRFHIVGREADASKGEIDGFRAFKETHPGAIYLHKGDTFLVDRLDLDTQTVVVSKADVDYYTRVRSQKHTEILETYKEKSVWGTTICNGRLKVTDQVTGYERWRIHAQKRLNVVPLDLPPQIFETEGIWFKIPLDIQREAERNYLHFMGGIHAIEHALIGVFPLIVMADRNDLGGISTTLHPQLASAAVFVYDGVPGGAGMSRQAFARVAELFEVTLDVVTACSCESGCPSCVHSPKCGSGNRPIDKDAAAFLLSKLERYDDHEAMRSYDREVRKAATPQFHPGISEGPGSGDQQKEQRVTVGKAARKTAREASYDRSFQRRGVQTAKRPARHSGNVKGRLRKRAAVRRRSRKASENKTRDICFGVFDVETKRSAQEVGGWHRADLMGMSCAVLYDSKDDEFYEFSDTQIPRFVEHLQQFELVVGFNIKRFDFRVLRGYTDFYFRTLPKLDILEEIHTRLGYRLSLEHLARVTLGKQKTADGLQALRWWKQGRIRDIIDYCKADVEITRDLYDYGRENGYLLFTNKAKQTVRVPVKW